MANSSLHDATDACIAIELKFIGTGLTRQQQLSNNSRLSATTCSDRVKTLKMLVEAIARDRTSNKDRLPVRHIKGQFHELRNY